jgi:hypothetical protein
MLEPYPLLAYGDSPWFLLAPILLLIGPLAILAVIVVVVELVYRKWQFRIRGLLITMTFIAVALGVFAAGK